jgi:hypothetical protein
MGAGKMLYLLGVGMICRFDAHHVADRLAGKLRIVRSRLELRIGKQAAFRIDTQGCKGAGATRANPQKWDLLLKKRIDKHPTFIFDIAAP